MDTIVFEKLANGNYAAPNSREEVAYGAVVEAIQRYNSQENGHSLFFKEDGNVYITNSPSVTLGK